MSTGPKRSQNGSLSNSVIRSFVRVHRPSLMLMMLGSPITSGVGVVEGLGGWVHGYMYASNAFFWSKECIGCMYIYIVSNAFL